MLPIKNNYQILTVMSGSMQPTIPIGALVAVKPASSYQVLDIITFHPAEATKKSETTTHRIISVSDKGGTKVYQTKGDVNNVADFKPVVESQIVGKYLFAVPLLGYIIGYTKTLPGLFLIIIVPATIIVYEEVRKIHREAKTIIEKRKNKNKKSQKEKNKDEKSS